MSDTTNRCIVVYNKPPAVDCMEFDGDFLPISSSGDDAESRTIENFDFAKCSRRVTGMSSTLAHCYTVNLRALDFCGVHLMAGMMYRARGIVVGGGNLPVLHYNRAVISDTPLDDPFAFADPVNITGVGTICDVKAYRSRFTCEGVITEVTLEHKAQVGL
ncbi:hypothetical protein PtB15_7B93 [Puccinia triticina]|nr:hypothetical protein PtB15_7B93 [Puccinia triticina]